MVVTRGGYRRLTALQLSDMDSDSFALVSSGGGGGGWWGVVVRACSFLLSHFADVTPNGSFQKIFFFFLFRAVFAAYGGSQARG